MTQFQIDFEPALRHSSGCLITDWYLGDLCVIAKDADRRFTDHPSSPEESQMELNPTKMLIATDERLIHGRVTAAHLP